MTQTVPRLGAAGALTLVIVGQLLAGLILDHFGLLGMTPRPVDLNRFVGVGLLVAGGYMMVR